MPRCWLPRWRQVAFFLVVGFVAWNRRAVPQFSPTPLLSVHTREVIMVFGGEFAETDLFITTDGVSRSTSITGDRVLGWIVTRAVIHASSGQLAALRAALVEAQIGQQSGDCQLPVIVPFQEGIYEMTWYGRPFRTNSIAMSLGGDGQFCPPALVAVVRLLVPFGGPQVSP